MGNPNTNSRGGQWRHDQIHAAWNRAAAETGYDADCFRRDACGSWIRFSEFGSGEGSEHGWYIGHILPVSLGGTDDPGNLQALHWSNGVCRGNRQSCADGLVSVVFRQFPMADGYGSGIVAEKPAEGFGDRD